MNVQNDDDMQNHFTKDGEWMNDDDSTRDE
jgi:hypothetical protein